MCISFSDNETEWILWMKPAQLRNPERVLSSILNSGINLRGHLYLMGASCLTAVFHVTLILLLPCQVPVVLRKLVVYNTWGAMCLCPSHWGSAGYRQLIGGHYDSGSVFVTQPPHSRTRQLDSPNRPEKSSCQKLGHFTWELRLWELLESRLSKIGQDS